MSLFARAWSCDALVGHHTLEGACDDVDLSGLTLGYVASRPGAIHQGNGRAAIILGCLADPRQPAALEESGAGRAGPGPARMDFTIGDSNAFFSEVAYDLWAGDGRPPGTPGCGPITARWRRRGVLHPVLSPPAPAGSGRGRSSGKRGGLHMGLHH